MHDPGTHQWHAVGGFGMQPPFWRGSHFIPSVCELTVACWLQDWVWAFQESPLPDMRTSPLCFNLFRARGAIRRDFESTRGGSGAYRSRARAGGD